MSRFATFVFGPVILVCMVGISVPTNAQGPVRSIAREVRAQRADYPGPVDYSPSDPDTRSKRFRLQTGHYGLFYNCDCEEAKRNSPYICWNSQHRSDWRNGWRNALRFDRRDAIQRVIDGSCESCVEGYAQEQVQGADAYLLGQNDVDQGDVRDRRREAVASHQRPVINANAIEHRGSLLSRIRPVEPTTDAKRQAETTVRKAPQRNAKQNRLFRIR